MDYNKIKATWWSGTCYHLEQLNHIVSSTDIKAYSHILHDKDKQENNLAELKKPHYHFLVQFYTNQRGAWFKAFASDDMGIVFAQPCYFPKGAYDYLIHDTPTARKQKKFLYDESERTSTIETFETDEKPDENEELFNDLQQLMIGQLTWHELIKKKPKRIHMIANISRAYDLLFYETYNFYPRDKPQYKQTQPKPQMQPPPKIKPPIELVPINDPKELDDMPF